MRAFLDILRFDLRLHLASPLFAAIALVFFLLNFLTQARIGINLGTNELLALNGTWLIFQTQLVLGVFGMLPALVFAVTAITRDHERNTLELFFTTPLPRSAYLLGRLTAGIGAATLIALIGMLGARAGLAVVDAERLQPHAWQPWLACFAVLVLPNLLVFCTLFFGVGALTRSTALTFGAALGVLVLEVMATPLTRTSISGFALVMDPFGALPLAEATRYWTVSELNTLLPTGLLLPNRLFWLGLAAGVLALTCWRFRMELTPPVLPSLARLRRRSVPLAAAQAEIHVDYRDGGNAAALPLLQPRFDLRASLQQLLSQLRMDWRSVVRSPLLWIVLALGAVSTFVDASNKVSNLIDIPLYPATTLMLAFVRYGLLQYVQLLLIWYAAALIHRERECGVAGISGAAPCPDWVPVLAKTLVLWGIVLLLLLAAMLASIAAQRLAGYTQHEFGLYLQSLFVYHGFYYCMLAVLAVFVQVLSPGKWSGMLFMLLAFIVLMSLGSLGFEHLLYSFAIPLSLAFHTDMNGFALYAPQTYTLIAYWGAFCVLLLIAAHLLFPRGQYATVRERLRDARTRLSAPVISLSAAACAVFAGMGALVFYNTNVLNPYVTTESDLAEQARYERSYGRYRDMRPPSFVHPDVRIELYPAARRMESRGTMELLNDTRANIAEFVISVDKRNQVEELLIDGATLVESEPALGFYLFRPDAPLRPGATLPLRWTLRRENRGFPNANPDNYLVANGTFLRTEHLPLPGYCFDCELSFGPDRERFGLPRRARLPALGDPQHLDDLWSGLTTRSSMRAVIGTDGDQTAVAPGRLLRSWEENGRRYFEYEDEGPVWPLLAVMSARYTVARADWNGVPVEVYHDAKHPWNIQTMLTTATKGLDYYSREFGPYALGYYRMIEYPRYSSAVQAGAGMIAYSEVSGFMTDLREWTDLDYATLHELAHQWWGNVYGANMQGRQFLNEGLAQYSTFMAYKELAEPQWIRRILAYSHRGYLVSRSRENVAEQPVLLTEDQGYISYNKAALGLFALQELIGADKVNGALRRYYARFLPMRPPLPTSRDLIDELRAAAGPEYQQFITDYFERIMLHDVQVSGASVTRIGSAYEVTIDVDARQFEADGVGNETEVPLDTWFEVVVFPDSDAPLVEQTPLYQRQHRLKTGAQRITVRVSELPGSVGVDPFHLMIDRVPGNNLRDL